MAHFGRRAFTLVELLVVIAIIGILMAMILPAVQASREAGRRTQCKNNLRNLGQGFQTYHTAQRRYPACKMEYFRDAKGNKLTTPRNHNWAVYLLPYIEETQLDRQYTKGENWNHSANRAVIRTPITLFLCPSSPDQTRDYLDTNDGFTMAVLDYTVSHTLNQNLYSQPNFPAEFVPKGTLSAAIKAFPDEAIELPDSKIYDGLSKTFCLIEDAGRPGYFLSGGKLGPANHVDKNPAFGNAGNQDVKNGICDGGGWADPDNKIMTHSMAMDGLSAIGPCAMNCTNNNEPYSFHPGGIVVTMADGSTHFVSEDMSIGLYAALTTRAGGEVTARLPD